MLTFCSFMLVATLIPCALVFLCYEPFFMRKEWKNQKILLDWLMKQEVLEAIHTYKDGDVRINTPFGGMWIWSKEFEVSMDSQATIEVGTFRTKGFGGNRYRKILKQVVKLPIIHKSK